MKKSLHKLALNARRILTREEGQDLIEYALVVALIAFAATVGMGQLASGINTAFSNVATALNQYI